MLAPDGTAVTTLAGMLETWEAYKVKCRQRAAHTELQRVEVAISAIEIAAPLCGGLHRVHAEQDIAHVKALASSISSLVEDKQFDTSHLNYYANEIIVFLLLRNLLSSARR